MPVKELIRPINREIKIHRLEELHRFCCGGNRILTEEEKEEEKEFFRVEKLFRVYAELNKKPKPTINTDQEEVQPPSLLR